MSQSILDCCVKLVMRAMKVSKDFPSLQADLKVVKRKKASCYKEARQVVIVIQSTYIFFFFLVSQPQYIQSQ